MKSGFALAEGLVALALAGILLAGTVQVLVAGLAHGARVNRALAARRRVDWALARLAGDLEWAGHLLALPGRTLPPGNGWPGGRWLLPGGPEAAGARPGGPGRHADLAFGYDQPLPAALDLAEALPAGAGTLRLRTRRPLRLRAGDLLLVPGQRLAWATVADGAALVPDRPVPVALAPPLDPDGWAGPRPAGTPLEALRPARLVRFAVVPLEPGGEPCLVRDESAWPGTAPEAGGDRAGRRREVLARGVARFQVAFTPAAGRRPAGFSVDLAVAGTLPGDRAAGTLQVALRQGGVP